MENSNIKKIFFNSTSMLGANYIAYIISFIVGVMLIRYLGSIRFGQYSFVIAFVSFFGFLGDFGIGRLLIREVSRNRGESEVYLGNFLVFQSLLSVFIFFFIVISINLLNYPQAIKTFVYIAGIGTSFYLISRVFETIITAYEYIYYNALIAVSYKAINSLLILVVILLRKGILELASSFLISSILIVFISGLICFKNCCLPKLRIDFGQWKLYLRNGFDFGLINLFAVTTANMGVIILSKIKGDSEVGVFSSAYKIPLSIILIATSLDAMLYSLFSRQYTINKEKTVLYFRKAIRYLSFLGFPVAVFFSLFSKQVIFTLFGNSYLEAVPALGILIWVVPFSFLTVLCHVTLTSINRVRPVTLIVAFSCILYIFINMIFIKRYGYLALCWSSLLVPIAGTISLGYFINQEFLKVKFFIFEILPSLILSSILFLIFSLTKINNLWLLIILYSIAHLAILTIFLLGDKYDRNLLKAIMNNLLLKRGKVS